MAKRLLLNVLVEFLGDYIEGLSEENLKLGIWSGKLELRNLALKVSTLHKLDLPLTALHGSVKNLKVTIPWTSLESSPVRIVIDGVYLLVGPLDLSTLSREDLKKHVASVKREILLNAERVVELASQTGTDSSEAEKNKTYLRRLTTKIVDNIEITVRNVHIRYEDTTSIAGMTLSAGLTLDSFSVTTTDAEWNEMFVTRDMSSNIRSCINKLASIKNLGLYWNIMSTKPTNCNSLAETQNILNNLIYTDENTKPGIEMYLLTVPNRMVLKLTHREAATDNAPKLDVLIESTPFSILLEEQQFRQVLGVTHAFLTAERKKQIHVFRPTVPLHKSPKAWWLYAIRALSNKQRAIDKVHVMQLCFKYRNRYISLLKQIRNESLPPASKEDLEVEISAIEEVLPTCALVIYRQFAMVDILAEASLTEKKSTKSVISKAMKSSSKMLSSFSNKFFTKSPVKSSTSDEALTSLSSSMSLSSTSSDSRDEDDLSIESIRDQLQNGLPLSVNVAADFTLHYSSYSTVVVTSNGVSVIELVMAVSAVVEMKAGAISVRASLDDLLITDLWTPSPILPHLLTIGNPRDRNRNRESSSADDLATSLLQNQNGSRSGSANANAKTLLVYEGSGGNSNLKITALPCIFAWNKPCLQKLLDIFVWSGSAMSTAANILRKSFEASVNSGTFHISLEADAPKIIIPDDLSADKGFFYLDNGRLTFNGSFGDRGMEMDIRMVSINAAECDRLEQIAEVAAASSYVIRPFDIIVNVQDTNREHADTTVHVAVTPEVRGELHPAGLERLVRVILTFISTILPPEAVAVKEEDQVQVQEQQQQQVVYAGAAAADLELRGLEVSQDNINKNKKSNVSLGYVQRIDPMRVNVDISIQLPRVALQLPYLYPAQDHLLLSLSDLNMRVKQRAHDMCLVVEVQTLRVEDSQRCPSQRSMAYTPPGSTLVHVSYTSCSHRSSPLYRGFGSEVEVNFSQLDLNIDPRSLLHLRPYYVVLVASNNTPIVDVVAATGVTNVVTDLSEGKSASGGLPAVHVVCTLGMVSLELLRSSPDDDNNDSTGPAVLNSVCTISMRGLSADIAISDSPKTSVRLRSFDVTDTSPVRSDYVFRKILCPDTAHASPHAMQLSSTTASKSIPPSSEGDAADQDLFTLTFVEEEDGTNMVDINLCDIACFLSMDCVLDIADLFIALTASISELSAPIHTLSAADAFPLPEGPSVQLTVAPASVSSHAVVVPTYMHVRININNPRVILLEDPTQISTRAIVARCGANVRFSIVGTTEEDGTLEVVESLQVSVQDLSLCVLFNLMRWNPEQIINPFVVDVLHKRTLVNGVPISIGFSLCTDDIEARIALNDVVLIHSIVMRASLFDSPEGGSDGSRGGGGGDPTLIKTKRIAPDTVSASDQSLGKDSIQLTAVDVIVRFGTVSVTLINDFNAQNIPVIRAKIDGFQIVASGFPVDLEGSGNCCVSVDFFNTKIACWEPVLEPWTPGVSLSYKMSCVSIALDTVDILQITISGQLTRTLLQTYSQLIRLDNATERDSVYPLTIRNRLGVPVVLVNSATDETVVHLQPYDTAGVAASVSNKVGGISSLPAFLELQFAGVIAESRSALHRLPVNSLRCKSYYVQTKGGGSPRTEKALVLEPVAEEIIQNQRYDPMHGWREPFIAYDPVEYTDAHGGAPRNKDDVSLPNDGWEWQGDWKVSMNRPIGVEIDKDGWDYGINFSDLSSPRGRRVFRPLDVVRRRRWIRMRKPLDSKVREDDISRPWLLFWDVTAADNGSRQISIFSRLRVQNLLPFAVSIAVRGSSWDGLVDVCEVAERDESSVPISMSNSTSLCLRPAMTDTYGLCQEIDCRLAAHDYRKQVNIVFPCSSSSTATSSSEGIMPIYATVTVEQKDKSLRLSISAHHELMNLLPCDLQYRCITDRGPTEGGNLAPGSSCHIVNTDPKEEPNIALKVGTFEWSEFFPLDSMNEKIMNITLIATDADNNDSDGKKGRHRHRHSDLVLNMCSSSSTSMMTSGSSRKKMLVVYSETAIIDRTGLDICIRSKCSRKNQDAINIRYTSSLSSIENNGIELNSMSSEFGVSVNGLTTASSRKYELHPAEIDALVYTDRDLRWIYLPDSFKFSTFLSTPCDDRALRSEKLIRFQVDKPSIVVLMFDIRVKYVPAWVTREGYQKIAEQAIADKKYLGEIFTFHYTAWGKRFDNGYDVILESNASRDSRGMYTAFIIGANSPKVKPILAQLIVDKGEFIQEAKDSWANGDNGMGLFYSKDGKACLGVHGGTAWSDDLPVSVVSSSKGRFELVDKTTNMGYQLAYTVSAMSGIFQRTKVVKVMPHYCIVNCMEDVLYMRQLGDDNETVCSVDTWQCQSWHKKDVKKGTALQFRSGNANWSLGAVDINEVGSSVLLLPTRGLTSEQSDYAVPPIVLHLEVKEAEPEESCYMMIVVWRSSIGNGATLSIRNDCNFPISLRQADVSFGAMNEAAISKFDICVLPRMSVPYGWVDPQAGTSALVTVGHAFGDAWVPPVKINLMHASDDIQQLMEGAYATVQALGRGRVLRIVNDLGAAILPEADGSSAFVLDVNISSIGISLVVEKPIRRELFGTYINGVVARYKRTGATQCAELWVYDLQMDNYSDAAVDPVLIRSAKKEQQLKSNNGSGKGVADLPVLNIVVSSESHVGSFTPHFTYIGGRLLELVVCLDSGTLEQIIADLMTDFEYVSWDDALASNAPYRWINAYNADVLSLSQHMPLVDVYIAKKAARADKMYFESIMLHPIKISLSFQKSTTQRHASRSQSVSAQASYWLEVIPTIVAVDRMPFKLSSFIVSDALESSSTLLQRILSKTMLDLQYQSARIAGSYLLSLSVLGRPAGLAKNIGGGVQNFFYEPYEGALQSPKDFVVGIGKGTTGLVSSVVSGAFSSTSSIVGTASDSLSMGMTFLSSDEDYSKKRQELRQQRQLDVARGGAMAGFLSGGETIVTGIASGLTGLVYTPINEAKKGGAVGFLKGVGLGVIGAAVKPVLGVTDGIASITQGISNTVGNVQVVEQIRPPRVLERLDGDSNDLVLVPLDMHAALAQAYVGQLARKNGVEDVFFSVIRLQAPTRGGGGGAQNTTVEDIILSERYLIWRRGDRLWTKAWADISHIQIEDTLVTLHMYAGSDNKGDPVTIQCGSTKLAGKLYTELYRHAGRMGNPGGCLHPDVALRQNDAIDTADDEESANNTRPMDEYPFGSVNGTNMGPFEGSEEVLIATARQRLQLVSDATPGQLDEEVWRIIWNWECTHTLLQSMRCCAFLVINRSSASLQMTRMNMREGKSLLVLAAKGYEMESCTLVPGGAMVMFAFAHRPSLLDKAHIKFDVVTTAFTATVSTRQNRTVCESLGNFRVGFLEKSLTDWWGKYVLLVR
eukprot:gene4154-8257_t